MHVWYVDESHNDVENHVNQSIECWGPSIPRWGRSQGAGLFEAQMAGSTGAGGIQNAAWLVALCGWWSTNETSDWWFKKITCHITSRLKPAFCSKQTKRKRNESAKQHQPSSCSALDTSDCKHHSCFGCSCRWSAPQSSDFGSFGILQPTASELRSWCYGRTQIHKFQPNSTSADVSNRDD